MQHHRYLLLQSAFIIVVRFILCKCITLTSASNDNTECHDLKLRYSIIVGQDWGSAPASARLQWSEKICDNFFKEELSWNQTKLCNVIRTDYHVVSFNGWRALPMSVQWIWNKNSCNNHCFSALTSNSKPYNSSCNKKTLPEWYRGIPITSKGKSEPLIAILTATTSQKSITSQLWSPLCTINLYDQLETQ